MCLWQWWISKQGPNFANHPHMDHRSAAIQAILLTFCGGKASQQKNNNKRSLILNQVFPSREFDLCVFAWDEETPLVVKDLETRSHHHSNVFSRDPGILPPREFVLRNGHQRSILDTGSQQPPVNEISQAFQLEMSMSSMWYLYSKLKAFSLA